MFEKESRYLPSHLLGERRNKKTHTLAKENRRNGSRRKIQLNKYKNFGFQMTATAPRVTAKPSGEHMRRKQCASGDRAADQW